MLQREQLAIQGNTCASRTLAFGPGLPQREIDLQGFRRALALEGLSPRLFRGGLSFRGLAEPMEKRSLVHRRLRTIRIGIYTEKVFMGLGRCRRGIGFEPS